jgi:hypothetical protein
MEQTSDLFSVLGTVLGITVLGTQS